MHRSSEVISSYMSTILVSSWVVRSSCALLSLCEMPVSLPIGLKRNVLRGPLSAGSKSQAKHNTSQTCLKFASTGRLSDDLVVKT
jgi:hypothetical protein